jgi:hypothetical protein
MESLKLEKSTALRIFKKASEEVKEILIEAFGKECFSTNIIDRIKTFEDAYHEADKEIRKDYDENCTGTSDRVAYSKLKLISKVMWEGVKIDWNNSNQYKYWSWFNLSSGLGFDGSCCHYGLTITLVGSRLCYPSKEISDYVAKQFIEIYKDWLI